MKGLKQHLGYRLPHGRRWVHAAQLVLAVTGVLLLLVGLGRLPTLGLAPNQLVLGVVLVFLLAMQFFLAALVLPGATCLAGRRTRWT